MTSVARRAFGLVKRRTIEIPLKLYNKLLEHSRQQKKSINQVLSERINPWLEELTVPQRDD